MQQSNTMKINSLCIDYPDGSRRVRVTVRKSDTLRYETVEIPSTTAITETGLNNAIKQMTDYYEIEGCPKWLIPQRQMKKI